MAEYIERKAAIKAVEKNDCEGYASWAIKSVPVADVVERKHGEWGYRWKVHGDGRRPTELFPCSECGYENTSATNFCPNCGADMRGEDDGT